MSVTNLTEKREHTLSVWRCKTRKKFLEGNKKILQKYTHLMSIVEMAGDLSSQYRAKTLISSYRLSDPRFAITFRGELQKTPILPVQHEIVLLDITIYLTRLQWIKNHMKKLTNDALRKQLWALFLDLRSGKTSIAEAQTGVAICGQIIKSVQLEMQVAKVIPETTGLNELLK